MGEEIITFVNNQTAKWKFHNRQNLIVLEDTNNIHVSSMISPGEKIVNIFYWLKR